jgi:hypothetical protein
MSSITNVLIDYWQRLPALPVEERREQLEGTRLQVSAGATTATALVPFALGDADEHIVSTATTDYVRGVGPEGVDRGTALADALEWIRRGLALNRSAVFVALLALGDERVNESLASLRLTLAPHETHAVFRRAAQRHCPRTRAFLRDWRELLDDGAVNAARSTGVVGIAPDATPVAAALAA